MVAWVPPSYAHIYSLLASLGFLDSAELLLVVVMTVRFLSLLRARRNNRMHTQKKKGIEGICRSRYRLLMRICVRYLTRCRSIPRDVVIAIIAALCSNNIFVLYVCTAQLSLSFLTAAALDSLGRGQSARLDGQQQGRKTSKESGASWWASRNIRGL